MERNIDIVKRIYDRFNARDIDAVLETLADEVAWANGMEGGHVQGKDAVRAYWTRQWAMVSPHVEPVQIDRTAEDTLAVRVEQSVRDLDGKPLEGQTHGLKDKTLVHLFRFRNGKITHFDLRDDA